MHRPRTEGRREGVGEVSWAQGGCRTSRGMEGRGREWEQGGPRAPPTPTSSLQEQEGLLCQKQGFSLRQDQPGQPGKGTEAGRFSQPHAWGRPGQWGPSHTPVSRSPPPAAAQATPI